MKLLQIYPRLTINSNIAKYQCQYFIFGSQTINDFAQYTALILPYLYSGMDVIEGGNAMIFDFKMSLRWISFVATSCWRPMTIFFTFSPHSSPRQTNIYSLRNLILPRDEINQTVYCLLFSASSPRRRLWHMSWKLVHVGNMPWKNFSQHLSIVIGIHWTLVVPQKRASDACQVVALRVVNLELWCLFSG